MVALKKLCVIAALAALSACGSTAGDNVMSPDANALDPAALNLALGPETSGNGTTIDANDLNSADNLTDDNEAADDRTGTNSAE
jgi:hypothetical protein